MRKFLIYPRRKNQFNTLLRELKELGYEILDSFPDTQLISVCADNEDELIELSRVGRVFENGYMDFAD